MSQLRQLSVGGQLIALGLTQREAEILFWISEGKSNHDIGIILHAATRTIEKHTEHILAKLHVENRTAAAAVALEKIHQPPAPGNKWISWQAAVVVQQLIDWCLDLAEICDVIVA